MDVLPGTDIPYRVEESSDENGAPVLYHTFGGPSYAMLEETRYFAFIRRRRWTL